MFSFFLEHRTLFLLFGIYIAGVLFLYTQQNPSPTATSTQPAQNYIGIPGTITIKAPLFQIIPKQNIYFKTNFTGNYDRTPWQRSLKNSHQEIQCSYWAIRTGDLPPAKLVFQPIITNKKDLFLAVIPPMHIQQRPYLRITAKLPHKKKPPQPCTANIILIILASIAIFLDIALYFRCCPAWQYHKIQKKITAIPNNSPHFAEQLNSILRKISPAPASSSFLSLLLHELYSKHKYNSPQLNALLKQHALSHSLLFAKTRRFSPKLLFMKIFHYYKGFFRQII